MSERDNEPASKHRVKSRRYPGEKDAQKLIEWLNEPDTQLKAVLANPPDHIKAALSQGKNAFLAITPAVRERRERVETIIGLWQSLTEDASEFHQWNSNSLPDTKPWKMDGGKKIREKLERAKNRLNSLLKRYAGRRELVAIDHTNKSFVRMVGGTQVKLGDGYDIRDREREWNSIGIIAELAARGLLGKIRRCEQCERWLFTRFTHQTCCSGGKCRQSKYRSSPEWKEHRRKWQRANYQTHKEKDQGRELTVSESRIAKKRRG